MFFYGVEIGLNINNKRVEEEGDRKLENEIEIK